MALWQKTQKKSRLKKFDFRPKEQKNEIRLILYKK